jgi:hypothetical protein
MNNPLTEHKDKQFLWVPTAQPKHSGCLQKLTSGVKKIVNFKCTLSAKYFEIFQFCSILFV